MEELVRQLQDAGARYLATAPAFLDKGLQAGKELTLREIFVFGEGRSSSATPFDSLLISEGDVPAVTIDPCGDVVVMPYSSGTTGLPKGVMLTHRNLVATFFKAKRSSIFGRRTSPLACCRFFTSTAWWW